PKDRAATLFFGLFASLDQFGDTTSAFSTKLRVSLAPELCLARLSAFAAELRVAARSELRLAGFAALSSEACVSLGTELSLTGLPTAPPDLAIERRAVFARGRAATALARLTKIGRAHV